MTPRLDVEAVLQLDRVVHEPARLMILSILAGADEVEFRFIEELSGLTKGNLSSHLSRLEAAGLVDITKSFRGRRPLTTLRMTAEGRRALSDYRARLRDVVAGIPETGGAASTRRR